ncbi:MULTISPECIES: carbonic anhydrase [unclassified Paludibacterium]|uniref:carbonic anhydrase n=1 Tax=unclassified Paludibacterium TaxID=2618429 RepID=UPI001C03B067|nr:carbonic anhydrase [Paludibacterium sp. B53371]BEV73687.1 carbonic anhydrase [Paludibacterium sp. THUN1379]
METVNRLLIANQAWAERCRARDPEAFLHLSRGQRPSVFWVGCADSRVPAERLTNAAPGELFVYRHIANLLLDQHGTAMSALEYAVEVLQVPHIVICAHSGCGGVRAALEGSFAEDSSLGRHLQPLVQLARRHASDLQAFGQEAERIDCLAQLSVMTQLEQLAQLPLIRQARRRPVLHGLMFDLGSGRLRRLPHPGA